MAKRITFDIEIIETLYTSLRQITAIVWRSSKEWHTRTRMDDVDYLVEDNARDDFACACSPELEHFHIHQGFTNIRAEDPGNTSYYHDER